VVASLQAALEKLIEKHRIDGLVLIGHSGGGTLAMLLAERIHQTRKVVTLAGNLDTEAWTAQQGYSPLTGSLNPTDRPELPSSIKQVHFIGAEDRTISPEPARKLHVANPRVKLIEVEGVRHESGWDGYFCQLLAQIGGACKTQPSHP
jgi:alpha-beta hydrolase superfamily lysophospholipase